MQSNNFTVVEQRSHSASNYTFQNFLDSCHSVTWYYLGKIWARYLRKKEDTILFFVLGSIVGRIESLLDITFLSDFDHWFLEVFLGDFHSWMIVNVPAALHALRWVPSCLLALAFLAAWSLLKSNLRIASLQREIYLLDGATMKYR